jgi:hypothetical protein
VLLRCRPGGGHDGLGEELTALDDVARALVVAGRDEMAGAGRLRVEQTEEVVLVTPAREAVDGSAPVGPRALDLDLGPLVVDAQVPEDAGHLGEGLPVGPEEVVGR